MIGQSAVGVAPRRARSHVMRSARSGTRPAVRSATTCWHSGGKQFNLAWIDPAWPLGKLAASSVQSDPSQVPPAGHLSAACPLSTVGRRPSELTNSPWRSEGQQTGRFAINHSRIHADPLLAKAMRLYALAGQINLPTWPSARLIDR